MVQPGPRREGKQIGPVKERHLWDGVRREVSPQREMGMHRKQVEARVEATSGTAEK